MNIAVIGTGYVGLVTGTCLSEIGHDVVCMDTDTEKVARLQRGESPIYEAGLEELLGKNIAADRLRFTSNIAEALTETEIVFLAVGTPTADDGGADLSQVFAAAEAIAGAMVRPLVIVQKSTCPVGTSAEIERRVASVLADRGADIPFDVAVNPEFLREGSAVQDFLQPDRVVIGADNAEVASRIAALYEGLVSADRILLMDRVSAEMTKYAANAFLATKISFINEIANLCEVLGADITAVSRGMGTDHRIGPAFLNAGIGYGGSCFPKDVQALAKTGRENERPLTILEAAEAMNRQQRGRQFNKVVQHFGGNLVGKRIAIWGLAFKPGTDDMREAPAIDVIHHLIEAGAEVVAYDPAAVPVARQLLDERVGFATNALACVQNSDALILLTEWDEFLSINLNEVAAGLADKVLFDFRNAFSPLQVAAAGFLYYGVGGGGTPAQMGGVHHDFALNQPKPDRNHATLGTSVHKSPVADENYARNGHSPPATGVSHAAVAPAVNRH